MYLYAALLLVGTVLALPLRIASAGPREVSFLESFRRGWSTLAAGRGRPLLQLAAVDTIGGFLSVAPIVLLALVAVRTFSGSTTDYAILFVAYVVGGAVASLWFAHINPRRWVGAVLTASLALSAAAFVAVAFGPSLVVIAASVWFAVGFLFSAYLVAKYAFLRGFVPAEQLARVTSNLYLFPGVASVAGAFVLGAAAIDLSPPALALWVALGLALAGAAAWSLPGVRRLSF